MLRALTYGLAAALFLTSCGDNDKFDFRLQLTSNSPVNFNEPLKVEVKEVFDDYTYEMIGPDGRPGDGTSYSTSKARSSDAGWYKVVAYGSDDFSAVDSVFVDVVPATIDCTPAVNTLRSNFANVSMDFYGVGGYDFGGGTFEVIANSVDGDMNLRFGHEHELKGDRTYVTTNNGSFSSEDEVRVYVLLAGGTVNVTYHAKAGQYVHVTEENGKAHITLCDFEVSSQNVDMTVDVHLEVE